MKCPKCDYDPEDIIRNEMMVASKIYNILKEPSYCGERSVPIEKAIEIAKNHNKNPELLGEK